MKNFFKSKTIILAVIILLAGAGFLVWKLSSKKEHQETSQAEAASIYEYQEVSSAEGGQISTNINEYQIYTNSKYNLSFQYPKGFTVTNFQEGEYGETILVRSSNEYREQSEQVSTNINKYPESFSFQIFISPFDEPGPLTKERILADVPDMVIENPEQRVLKNGVPGLIFFSQEPSIGKTREVWFIHNGYLYQISTYAELDSWLAEILGTWKFH